MRSEDDDLLKELSSRLTEEVGNLPKDGQDHEFRIKIKGNRGNINLGHQTIEIKSAKAAPPRASDRARDCPQCGKSTWRYTQLCMHCDYDLHRHDAVEAEERAELRREQANTQLVKIFSISVVVAIAGFSLKGYFPEGLQNWVMGVSVVAGMLAFAVLQGTR